MESNNIKADMRARMIAGTRCFYALQKALWFNNLTRKATIMIYKTAEVIRLVVMCDMGS